MMHPDTELKFISADIGYGVFAKTFIPRGTITWVTDELDRRFTREEVERLHPMCREMVDKYAFVVSGGESVLCWDHGRFVNHACRPNCLSAGLTFEFAIHDIAAGEELNDDYGLMNLTEPLECRCGAPDCRRAILPDDLDRHAGRWDGLVAEAFPSIGAVAQPLWPLLGERHQVEHILAGRAPIPSCSVHRFHSPASVG